VQTGRRTKEWIEILGGLKAGEVLVRDARTARPGPVVVEESRLSLRESSADSRLSLRESSEESRATFAERKATDASAERKATLKDH
jgi:hypothetical protein